ncbi:hypothetical protein GGI07_002139 [Coemansia sp. Benny D115]|nr:hypothetical protein GGI07_002139 [Coemansia sp. Benny D115]
MATSSDTAPAYILRYFEFTGLGEACRMLLTAAKANWVEENPEWPQEKQNQPFGRMPVLIEKATDGGADYVLSESPTIERYLGRVFGFLPADQKIASRQEQIRDQQIDIVVHFFIKHGLAGKDEAANLKFDELLSKMFEVHSRILRENGSNGHFIGDSLSFIDICTYAFFELFLKFLTKFQADITEVVVSRLTPEIAKLLTTVESDPHFEEYLSTRAKLGPLFADKVTCK